jgi:hypothetical protein
MRITGFTMCPVESAQRKPDRNADLMMTNTGSGVSFMQAQSCPLSDIFSVMRDDLGRRARDPALVNSQL